MARSITSGVNVGSAANDGTGDSARTAFQTTNADTLALDEKAQDHETRVAAAEASVADHGTRLGDAEDNIDALQSQDSSGDRLFFGDTFTRADTAAGSGNLGVPELGGGGEVWKCYDASPWPPGSTGIASASIVAPGTGYTVGDVLSVSGGTYSWQGKVTVTAISGGGATGPVASVDVSSRGYYTVEPTGTLATTGGTGTGCTVDCTFDDADALHQYIRIENGALRSTIGQTAYLVRDLPYAPNVMTAEIEFVDGNDLGAGDNATFAIAIGTMEENSRTDSIIHCTINMGAMVIQSGFPMKTHANRPFITGEIEKNKRYKVAFSFDAGVATLRVGPYSLTADHPDIGRYFGRHVYWEHYYASSTSRTDVKIHAVGAEVGLGAGPQFSSKTGVPAIARARQLLFTGGQDIVTCNTSALTSIADSNYTILWRGTVLAHQKAMQAGWMGLWRISAEATGLNWGHGPGLELQNTIYAASGWQLNYLFADGADYRRQSYGFEVQSSFKNKTVEIMATRDIAENKGELFLNGQFIPVEAVSVAGTPAPEWEDTFPQPSNYFHVGQGDFASPGNGWQGGIEVAAMFNMVVTGDDMGQIRRGIIPERLKWATNTALGAAVAMTVGKCYRLGSIGTADYWYAGCAEGDELYILSTTEAIKLTRPDETITMTTLTTDASNDATQVGCMVWLDGGVGNGQQMIDLSSNRVHGVIGGNVSMSMPEVADRPVISADAGDADATHTPDGRPVHTIRYDTTLTANRTVTLSTTGAIKGDVVKVVRTGLGAFTLDVGGLKTIASGTAATVEATYDGTAWVLTGYGAL